MYILKNIIKEKKVCITIYIFHKFIYLFCVRSRYSIPMTHESNSMLHR